MCVSPRSVSTSWSGFWLLGKGAPFGEGAPLWGRARPFGKGRALLGEGAPLWERACSLDLLGEKGRAPFAEGAPFWKRALSKCHMETLTYWFSIQYPDGVVQVVSTKGVAVSIAGCRLVTGPLRFSFIGNSPGRPVHNAPFLH